MKPPQRTLQSSHPVGTAARINLGCGASPTAGWLNYDNSLTVRIARYPGLLRIASRLKLVSSEHLSFAAVALKAPVVWANVTRHIPAPDNSVSVVYSSHMLEHLDGGAANAFLAEVRRVLEPGGVLRLAVPDLAILAKDYVMTGDGNAFINGTHLARQRPGTLIAKIRWLLVGDRGHAWMYDATSLIELLTRTGFVDARPLDPGVTTIGDAGQLNLREREHESLYVEARTPGPQAQDA